MQWVESNRTHRAKKQPKARMGFRLFLAGHASRKSNRLFHHGRAVHIIRNLLRHIINAEHCISSSRRKMHAEA